MEHPPTMYSKTHLNQTPNDLSNLFCFEERPELQQFVWKCKSADRTVDYGLIWDNSLLQVSGLVTFHCIL